MTGWTKYFADGTKFVGHDYAVAAKLASWTKSRNDSIVKVTLEHDGKMFAINGPGEFWQSDTYETVFPGPGSTLIKRRIMRKIEPTDKFFRECKLSNHHEICFVGPLEGGKFTPVKPNMYGKWLVLEYNLNGGNGFSVCFLKDKNH